MLRKLIILFLIFSLALFTVSELVLPTLISRAVQRGLSAYLGSDVASVKLEAHPAIKMLIGHFDQVTAEARDVSVGGMLVDSLTTSVSDLSVSMSDLILKREFRPVKEGSFGLVIRISEANLNKYLWSDVSGITDGHLTLAPNQATVVGNLNLQGIKVPVQAEGQFIVTGASQIAFQPATVSVAGVMLTQDQIALIRSFGGLKLSLDLSRLSPPLVAHDVQCGSGQLAITAGTK